MHYFSSKSSKASHLNKKIPIREQNFSTNGLLGGTPPPSPPLALALPQAQSMFGGKNFSQFTAVVVDVAHAPATTFLHDLH